MANKGIGVGECTQHGEYYLDAEDSPCPSCEDGVPSMNTKNYPGWTKADEALINKQTNHPRRMT
jgi:hypothetical protein